VLAELRGTVRGRFFVQRVDGILRHAVAQRTEIAEALGASRRVRVVEGLAGVRQVDRLAGSLVDARLDFGRAPDERVDVALIERDGRGKGRLEHETLARDVRDESATDARVHIDVAGVLVTGEAAVGHGRGVP